MKRPAANFFACIRTRQKLPSRSLLERARAEIYAGEKFIYLKESGFGGHRPKWHAPCLSGGMVDPIFQSANYQIARKLLDASALRQEAIAANIANAETPGYRRLDVNPDFAAQLRASAQIGEVSRAAAELRPRLIEDAHARTVRPDGNTVEIEHELLAMNRNAVEYEFLSEVVSRNIKQLKMAITGRSV